MKEVPFSYERNILLEGYDRKTCRIDGMAFKTTDGRMHITYRHLLLTGSDVFYGTSVISSDDGGVTFGPEQAMDPIPDTFENGIRTTYSLLPYFHEKTQKTYCIGRATRYADDKIPVLFQKDMMPAMTGSLDEKEMRFSSCERLTVPGLEDYDFVCFMQPLEEEDGTILVPAYVRKCTSPKHQVVVVRFQVVDGKLLFVEKGDIIERDDLERGLCEPRIARLGNKYYLTIRSNEIGFLAVSEDGLNYSRPAEWHWNDGELLTSRNTQQAWVSHPNGLFLVYTRETEYNKHVFRRRAPLFMARFDEDTNTLVKGTEIIAVPEMGARLGNFTAIPVSNKETWICVSEWMQEDPVVCESYGARNRLWRIKIKWE